MGFKWKERVVSINFLGWSSARVDPRMTEDYLFIILVGNIISPECILNKKRKSNESLKNTKKLL